MSRYSAEELFRLELPLSPLWISLQDECHLLHQWRTWVSDERGVMEALPR
jgi:hypothetical protein